MTLGWEGSGNRAAIEGELETGGDSVVRDPRKSPTFVKFQKPRAHALPGPRSTRQASGVGGLQISFGNRADGRNNKQTLRDRQCPSYSP